MDIIQINFDKQESFFLIWFMLRNNNMTSLCLDQIWFHVVAFARLRVHDINLCLCVTILIRAYIHFTLPFRFDCNENLMWICRVRYHILSFGLLCINFIPLSIFISFLIWKCIPFSGLYCFPNLIIFFWVTFYLN